MGQILEIDWDTTKPNIISRDRESKASKKLYLAQGRWGKCQENSSNLIIVSKTRSESFTQENMRCDQHENALSLKCVLHSYRFQVFL